MKKVVIVDAARTPIGAYGGSLRTKSAAELAAAVIRSIHERNALEKIKVDQVILGCVLQNGENAYVSRLAMLKAGLPADIPALTVNRLCGSGLEAVNQGAQLIQTGLAEVCIAGGTESMTNAPYLSYGLRWGVRINDSSLLDSMVAILTDPYLGYHMGVTAENLANKYGISRREQDEFALWSHAKAVNAQKNNLFKSEIVPVEVQSPKETLIVSQDEGPRADATIEKLEKLKPVFQKEGTVTAGNSSSLNDAASCVLLMSEHKARELGCRSRAMFLSQAVCALPPEVMGLGPAYAVPLALERARLSLKDIDIIESNEAFAAQALAVDRELQYNPERLNVKGGAIALGHPIGATGAILVTKALYELERSDKELALITLCIGGGQGIATVIRRLNS